MSLPGLHTSWLGLWFDCHLFKNKTQNYLKYGPLLHNMVLQQFYN